MKKTNRTFIGVIMFILLLISCHSQKNIDTTINTETTFKLSDIKNKDILNDIERGEFNINKLENPLQSVGFLSTGFQMFISLATSLFYTELSENIGQGVLANFIRGKYHRPKEEDRIFMFLDMKSSTTIAEQLGHVRYFELLKEYYYTLSDAVIAHSGEIYQYVGDEMVVSWKYKHGIRNNNCVECFFKMKNDLLAKQSKFETQFGVHPEFKAGLHLGTVTTGEIGSIKKEIIFTGDVLNATARIQALCNVLGVDILISKDIKDILPLEKKFQVISQGNQELRGKQTLKEVYTLQKITS
ncbi:MAG: adenylate/guanylate cyclase domain-containing protein [Bacteroidota bacterium]